MAQAGRVWFITGCSSGLGNALSHAVLESGDRLAATARDPNSLSSLVSNQGDNARSFELDVTKPDQIESSINGALEAFGRIDVLVNNAGFGLIGALEECEDDQIDAILQTNVVGPLRLMRGVLPHMREQQGGTIVNICAVAATSNHEGFSVYGASKAALEVAGDGVRAEAQAMGINVVNVEPGPFRTDFNGRSLTRVDRTIDAYRRTSGKFAKLLESMDGKQPGDPKLAAGAIIKAVQAEQPPSTLVLGGYASARFRDALEARLREFDAWETVGRSTDG